MTDRIQVQYLQDIDEIFVNSNTNPSVLIVEYNQDDRKVGVFVEHLDQPLLEAFIPKDIASGANWITNNSDVELEVTVPHNEK